MKIITSIHAYNFHLFISYLNEGVKVIPFHDFREGFNKINVIYPREISDKKSLQEIVTTGHFLLGINDFKISTFSLSQNSDKHLHNNFLNEHTVSQLSFDYSQSELNVFTEESGIINLNFKNPYRSEIKEELIPKSLEKLGSPTISNMISQDKSILLSIRGFGVSKIDRNEGNRSSEKIFRTEDAQDVLYLKNLELIAVADGVDGILLFENNSDRSIKQISLPNSDFPQEIKHFYNNILIKGQSGLYLYDPQNDKLRLIQECKIGAITHYYNYIIYSNKGEVNILTANENAFSHFKLRNEEDLDIKFNKFLR